MANHDQDYPDLADKFPSFRRLRFGRRWRRIPFVPQLTPTDCGAAALTSVIRYFGKQVALDEIRGALGTGRNGTSASSLLRVGRLYGLRGRGVHAEIADLASLPTGTILHWRFSHYVVLQRAHTKVVDIVDPANGQRSIPIENLRRAFTGVALTFECTETFEPEKAKPMRVWGSFKQILTRSDIIGRIIFVSLVIQLLASVMPFLTGVLIDRVVPRKDYSLLLILAIGFLVFQLFGAFANFIRSHLSIHLQTQLEARFTFRFLDHLVGLPYSFFQQRTSGDLMMRLGSNSSIKEILTSATLSSVMDGLMAMIYLALLMLLSVPLSLIVLFLALTRVLLLFFMRRKQRALLAQNLDISARSQSYQVEMLSGMETLKAMGLERRAADNWSNLFVESLNVSMKRGQLDAIFTTLQSLLGTFSTLTVMFYGTYLVLRGAFSLGTMLAFNALAASFFGPLMNLMASGIQLQMLEVYLERIHDVIDTSPEQDSRAFASAGVLRGAVTLEHVSFRYGKDDPLVVEDICVSVTPGSRMALVGQTGSGKSTLARLMAGLYVPSSGRILFDGTDLRTLDLRSVRSQLGLVTQDTQLFGGTIRQNIALADPHMNLDRVIQVAKLACIHDEIMMMAMTYDTVLADRGLSLSGGQRQRLALARALACKPAILVLDEATNHLDAITERQVNENLARLHCSRIVIAHRLNTIRDADLILVIASGRVVARGSHCDLLQSSPTYVELLGAQCNQDSPIQERF